VFRLRAAIWCEFRVAFQILNCGYLCVIHVQVALTDLTNMPFTSFI
jgi:hypothetical protein